MATTSNVEVKSANTLESSFLARFPDGSMLVNLVDIKIVQDAEDLQELQGELPRPEIRAVRSRFNHERSNLLPVPNPDDFALIFARLDVEISPEVKRPENAFFWYTLGGTCTEFHYLRNRNGRKALGGKYFSHDAYAGESSYTTPNTLTSYFLRGHRRAFSALVFAGPFRGPTDFPLYKKLYKLPDDPNPEDFTITLDNSRSGYLTEIALS